jgi:hypothetical protein
MVNNSDDYWFINRLTKMGTSALNDFKGIRQSRRAIRNCSVAWKLTVADSANVRDKAMTVYPALG